MALGVPGTGPYSRIRTLTQQIREAKYEISLIEQGVRKGSRVRHLKNIATDRAEIRLIREQIKSEKAM